jgi:hypothetical protein
MMLCHLCLTDHFFLQVPADQPENSQAMIEGWVSAVLAEED